MATVEETARNFRALGERKKVILDICRTTLKDGLDDVLAHLGETDSANGFWKSLYHKVRAANREAYPLPEQEGVRTAADNYAGGIIERMKEAILFNHLNPGYIAFVRNHGRLPEI